MVFKDTTSLGVSGTSSAQEEEEEEEYQLFWLLQAFS